VARPSGTKHEPPREVALPSPLAAFTRSSLERDGDYDAVRFDGLSFAGQVAEDANFLGCRFERCAFDETSLRRAHISECLLDEVRATSFDTGDSVWRDTLVTVRRVGAMLATGASWSSVRLRGGRLDLVDFSGARLVDVAIEGCAIGELDLGTAEARGLAFEDCEIELLDVTGARLAGADLTGATIGAVRGVSGLRGATITPVQLMDLAPQLAAHLGVKVRGD
jgi:uncharacterized protein YjbI with pentapeptide repeats